MTEMLATSWELPGGILAGPRVLSNATDAPLLGEAAVFWLSTVQPAPGVTVTRGGSVPLFTFVVLLGPLMLGVAFAWQRLRRARAWLHVELPFVKAQLTAWVVVTLAGVVVMLSGGWWAGLLLLAFSTFVPVASTSVAAARQDNPSLLQRAAWSTCPNDGYSGVHMGGAREARDTLRGLRRGDVLVRRRWWRVDSGRA